jgi:dihydrofolate reductase
MSKVFFDVGISVDGLFAGPNRGPCNPLGDGGVAIHHGGWTVPYWHDDIGQTFVTMMQEVDALLLGRRTYVIHAEAFEPNPAEDPFGNVKKYVVSRTLQKPSWRDTTIIRDNVIEFVRALKAEPGRNILTDGSSQLVHVLLAHDLVDELHLLVYPLTLGSVKRVLPSGVHSAFRLISAKPYPSGVVGLNYARQRG